MSQTIHKDRKIILLSMEAAVMTVVAGILHIVMAPRSLSEDLGEGILFSLVEYCKSFGQFQ